MTRRLWSSKSLRRVNYNLEAQNNTQNFDKNHLWVEKLKKEENFKEKFVTKIEFSSLKKKKKFLKC